MTAPFDVCGPLPAGVTVLEASAGTGKTWTIAALAARYVAEGTPLDKLLLVTFTRMATGELRDRVRERLVGTEQALSRALNREPPGDDPLVRLLARDDVARRRDNLSRALADFDAATIATIHGFCQEVLGGLGVAGDVEGELVEDPTDLVDEVVDDLYVRRFRHEDRPAITREEAGRVARIAVDNPTAPIEPRDAPEHTVPAMYRRLAEAVRQELTVRKRRAGVLTYDDLLTELNQVLCDERGEEVSRRLRDRWKVVLVDEFQDTDPVQWSIMRRAFGTGTLVLIGDPKQAIYAFRGADVYAYLDAARTAGTEATLDVNRRSDQALIDAYDALFAGARLGHEGIVYRKVRAARKGRGMPGTPLRIRVVQRADVRSTARGFAELPSVREHVANDVAADLVRLFSGGEAEPEDVAVLVQTNRNAARVRDALDAVGIPAVINGAGSVFGTVEAEQWLRLLEALERPTSDLRARSAALTPFLGWSAERVAAAGDEEWEDVHRRLHDWARVLRLRGVASLMETITLAEGLPARVLSDASGERRLTDLRHVGELLHAEQLGTTALAGWLRRRIAEAGWDTADEDRSRRLESDADAVQVLTVHRSKGLEFGVVYYPDLFEPGYIPKDVPVTFHDEADVRTIDVGMTGADFTRHREQFVVEQRGEDLRIAYVALTRARHQAVVWWAPTFGSRDSSLGRLLFERAADGTIPASGRSVPADADAWQRFEQLAGDAPGCIAVERSQLGLPLAWSGPPREPAELSAARFDRALDQRWRRTSFTDITSGAHEARVGSEPEEAVVIDEPEGPAAVAGELPLAAMPAGVEVGTFVHRVMEASDFAASDLDAELSARIAEVQMQRAVEIGEPDVVAAGLRAAIETPLGPLIDGVRLRDVVRADRLDELDFELPLVGGDEPTGALALDAIAAALRGGGLEGYADRLADPILRRDVRGYLTGSIDLVVRAGERFAVLDYKTNWLGAPGEPLTARHYRADALAAEMERSHYGLQALLYLVALHRYLRWRLPGYDPERNLAGAGYLFLRGMTGGAGAGVFAWRPPGAVVERLSDVLERGR
jgi:exodeoxyribonuclease V beta subunit